jgi:hypothetical protein
MVQRHPKRLYPRLAIFEFSTVHEFDASGFAPLGHSAKSVKRPIRPRALSAGGGARAGQRRGGSRDGEVCSLGVDCVGMRTLKEPLARTAQRPASRKHLAAVPGGRVATDKRTLALCRPPRRWSRRGLAGGIDLDRPHIAPVAVLQANRQGWRRCITAPRVRRRAGYWQPRIGSFLRLSKTKTASFATPTRPAGARAPP